MNSISIHNIELSHLCMVADVHCAAFPDSALTKLGKGAVRRYYEWQLVGPHEHIFVGAYQNDVLVGFCVGGISRGALGGFLKKNRLFLMHNVLLHPWLIITNPIFRKKLTQATRILIKRPLAPTPQPIKQRLIPSFGILSIATSPQHQGKGIGRELMRYAEQKAQEKDFKLMHLTVNHKNQQAIHFYEYLGWEKVIINGNWYGRMEKTIV
jgi:ribosomal protein S18 acetylase RimI-like enzyme